MKKKILIFIAAALLAIAIAVGIYAGDYYHADETAMASLNGSETVTVMQKENLTVFTPEESTAGFIFYPGGKVEDISYAPLMMELAEENILCVLVEMPLNLAVLDIDAANGIPEQFPEVESWYIGGHSLGGSMAAFYVAEHSDDFQGLVLLAAYSTSDLSKLDLDVLSIYGDQDGILNMEKYNQYRSNLPDSAAEVIIPGGNHAQFGSYGFQEGDGEAAITTQEQLAITAEQMLELIH